MNKLLGFNYDFRLYGSECILSLNAKQLLSNTVVKYNLLDVLAL